MKLTPLFRFCALGYTFISSTAFVHALDLTKPLAGDWRCGGSAPCDIRLLFPEVKDIYIFFLIVVAAAGLLALLYAIISVLKADDQPAEMAKQKKFGGRVAIWLVVLAFLGTLFNVMFDTLIKPKFNYIDNALSRVMEVEMLGVKHVYAEATGTEPSHLPNALKFDSAYDVIIVIVQLAMRWIGIPILIAYWVWSGFLFVYARGSPDGLKRAKSRLFYTVVLTMIFVVILGVVYAFKGTFNQIFT